MQFPPKEYFLNITDPDVRRDMEEVLYSDCFYYFHLPNC